jgi:two-component system, NarL family, response regulator NreC
MTGTDGGTVSVSNDGLRGQPAGIPTGDLAELGADLAARDYSRRGVSTSSETIRVALVDDHVVVRSGLKALLRGAPDMVVVGEASSGPEAVTLAARVGVDVIVMDLDMDGGDGATATRALAREAPGVRVLILTMHTEQEKLLSLLNDGARGYLAKDAAERELLDAIRVVAAGDVYVRPSVARMLAAAIVPKPKAADSAGTRFETLSDRERTVLKLVAEGFNGPEIGTRLDITAKTVDTYKQRIEDKLGLAHRSDYVRFALDAGLLGRAERR